MKIVIHIDESDATTLSKESIYEAIKNFFSYELDGQRSELKSYVKRAQTFFLIGLGILGSCLGIAQNITVSNPPGTMGIIREGIIIFGWVSIWKPIELVLFDWYPLFEKIRLYKKLFATEIEIQFISVDAATTSPPGRAIEF